MTRRALIAALFALLIAGADLVFAQAPDAFSYSGPPAKVLVDYNKWTRAYEAAIHGRHSP